MSRIGKTVCYSAFTEEVAEHKAADQRSSGWQKKYNEGCYDYGEDDLLGLGDLTGLHHLHFTHLFCCTELHKRRLNQGDQSHVGVRGNCDWTEQFRCKLSGKVDSGRTVGTAYNTDRGGLRAGESEKDGTKEGYEYSELCSSTEKKALRVGKQRTKVSHRANTHKYKRGINAGLNTYIEKVKKTAVLHYMAVAVVIGTACIKKLRPEFRVIKSIASAKGDEITQICEQAAESYAAKKQRLKFLYDSEVQKHKCDDDHDKILPSAVHEETGETGFKCKLLKSS